jgi:hypothetical protein
VPVIPAGENGTVFSAFPVSGFGKYLFAEFEAIFPLKPVIIFVRLLKFLCDLFLDIVIRRREQPYG